MDLVAITRTSFNSSISKVQFKPEGQNEACNNPEPEEQHSCVVSSSYTPRNISLPETFKEPVDRDASHMQYLLNQLPELDRTFKLHHKIGEGTFSTVFLGTLKSGDSSRQFAIKHLVPTTLPSRTERELRCLQEIGGLDNVVGVDLCLRRGDCIVFVMPYLPHTRFTDYVMDLGAGEVREYMRNLLVALRRVHSFNIIHRDVKPSNFLYDRVGNKFLLVDFGLAQSVSGLRPIPPALPLGTENKVKKRKREEETCDGMNNSAPVNGTEVQPKRAALQPRPNDLNVRSVERVEQPPKRARHEDGTSIPKAARKVPSPGCENMRPPSRPHTPGRKNLFGPRTAPSAFKSRVVTSDHSIKKQLFVDGASPGSPALARQKLGEITPPTVNPAKPKLAEITNTPRGNVAASPYMSHPKQKLGEMLISSGMTKQKFQTLAPERSTLSSRGSSLVRVQNSQVKSLKPLSPLESVQQKRSLAFPRPTPTSQCSCHGRPQVCSICVMKRANPAPRAGTPGFRPPEVLLKYPLQTTAVDMWACGVILLCILSGCYPFFRSPDDVTALAEIMIVFGSDRIKHTASKLGRVVHCSQHRNAMNLRKLCQRLRDRRESLDLEPDAAPPAGPLCSLCQQRMDPSDGCLCIKSVAPTGGHFPDAAYDLLERLLDLNADTRITAAQALDHPFIAG